MVGVVHIRYAEALYKVATSNNKIDLIADELNAIKKILDEQKDFMKILCHPKINEESKINMVKNIFDKKISEEIMGIITLVINKNRENILIKLFDEYVSIVKKNKNIVTATITSAIVLQDEHVNKIKDKLKQAVNKEIEIKTIIDKKIIGGLKIQVGNTVFDRTVKAKLENLRKAL